MSEIKKISIRFFNDREVRAIWDETGAKWWFSVLDIVGVLNAQDDYAKNRNYWKYLKTKLSNEGNEVVSATNQLKLLAPDGKLRLTDVLDNDGVIALADRDTFMKGIDYSYYYEQEEWLYITNMRQFSDFLRNFGVG